MRLPFECPWVSLSNSRAFRFRIHVRLAFECSWVSLLNAHAPRFRMHVRLAFEWSCVSLSKPFAQASLSIPRALRFRIDARLPCECPCASQAKARVSRYQCPGASSSFTNCCFRAPTGVPPPICMTGDISVSLGYITWNSTSDRCQGCDRHCYSVEWPTRARLLELRPYIAGSGYSTLGRILSRSEPMIETINIL